ncbi:MULTISPECIES: lytic transglycosylase domain-containing protein [Actinomadura]|uniref:Lytic transglycosylase domain-containing protein n=1 Tax=Actinomadura litoris TaxID=2678616 RepID=A0A7K1KXZ8_9ACTN|nr:MULTISPECIES: lytic transglycosylase domain-containing protein [Actinomadura]MBT2209121.1 lytic transglycosylase domain-containing protein [Actinomadura sp. NEAU-AAG7]MUN37064.1 lytic transglycosylase domain-containing protein [Actinomadura litoris]
MPQSHGTHGRPSGSSRRAGSRRSRGDRRRGDDRRVPPPRPAPDDAPAAAGPLGGDPRDTGFAPDRPSKRRRVWRFLTHNVTITVTAICGLVAALVLVDTDVFGGEAKPPKMAAPGMSTGDMVARLTGSDMDPIAADTIAAAKKRAYEEHRREMAELKEKAKRDAAARAKLKEEQERERLAKSNPSAGQNRRYGRKMSALKGWDRCWPSLLTLWNHESGWNERAVNPSSGAYGIPQALPGSKLASSGADWRTSSPTQIAWGLGYIKARYKDPCGAWSWWQAHNWY